MHPIHTASLACVIGALCAATPPAQAAVHVFNLTAHAAAGTYAQPGTSFSAFIDLSNDDSVSGLLPALTVSTGDTLAATVRLDQALTVPASVPNPQPYAAYFGFWLGAFDPAQVPGGTTIFATVGLRFFDGSTEVQPGPAALPDSGCGNLLCVGSTFVPATQAMRFDRVEMTAQVNSISGLAQVATEESSGRFLVFVLSPVPEPSSAGLLLTGLLATGVGRLRRRA